MADVKHRPPSAFGGRKKRDISAERRERRSSATRQEREMCETAYRDHSAACLRLGIAPSPRETFESEWIQIERAGLDEEKDEGHRHHARDYGRMFDGKSGFEVN